MTAIGAFYTPTHIPIVIGDLAVSGDETGEGVAVPSIGSTREVFAQVPGQQGYVVKGCMQKVVVCHDRLVVAWTGAAIAAAALLRELTQLTDPNTASLRSVIADQDDSILTGGLELLGFLAEPREGGTLLRRFHVKGRTLYLGSEQVPHFLGYGADEMREAFALAEQTWIVGGEPSEATMMLSKVLAVAGQLLTREMTTLQPLLRYFGGGYEIAHWTGRRFEKLENVVHVFWRALFSDEGLTLLPIRMLRPTYVESTLVANATYLQPTDNGAPNTVETYAINAPHKIGAFPKLPGTRFGGATVVCNYLIVEDRGKVVAFVSGVSGGPSLPIRITDLENNGYAIEADVGFRDQLTNTAMDQVRIARERQARKRTRPARSKRERNTAKRRRKGTKRKTRPRN